MLSVSPISNSVSRIHFGEGPLDRKGAFAKPEGETAAAQAAPAGDAPEKKKGGHAVRNTIIGLVVAAAALVTLKKTNVLKVLDEAVLKDAKFYSPKKIGHYLAKAGEAIGKYTYDPVANLCKKWFGKKAPTPSAGA